MFTRTPSVNNDMQRLTQKEVAGFNFIKHTHFRKPILVEQQHLVNNVCLSYSFLILCCLVACVACLMRLSNSQNPLRRYRLDIYNIRAHLYTFNVTVFCVQLLNILFTFLV